MSSRKSLCYQATRSKDWTTSRVSIQPALLLPSRTSPDFHPVTPHMAYSTEEAIRLFSEETRENVAAFLEGEREVLERRAIKG